jgi:hypothetical protein
MVRRPHHPGHFGSGYSLNDEVAGAQPMVSTTVSGATATVSISAQGVTTFTYQARDNASEPGDAKDARATDACASITSGARQLASRAIARISANLMPSCAMMR